MENGEVDMSKIKNIFNSVTTRTLRRDLTKLCEMNLITKIGTTKDTSYQIKDGAGKK